jgi:hypothetical protein
LLRGSGSSPFGHCLNVLSRRGTKSRATLEVKFALLGIAGTSRRLSFFTAETRMSLFRRFFEIANGKSRILRVAKVDVKVANSIYEPTRVSFSSACFGDAVLLRHCVNVSARWGMKSERTSVLRFGHGLRTLYRFVRNFAGNSYYVVDLLFRRLIMFPR